MGSMSDSEEQFTMHTDYSPPHTVDLASQATLAALAAAEENMDRRIDFEGGERKRKLISLTDETDDSDVEITPPTQTSNPRRKSSFGTATGKPMLQSTIDGGIGSSSQGCRKKPVPVKSVIRGGRRAKPLTQSQKGKAKANSPQKKKAAATRSQKKKKTEEIPDFDESLEEEELNEEELNEEEIEMDNRLRSDVWPDFTVVHKPNGTLKAVCNHCRNEYAWHSHSHGTSGLRRHHFRCKVYQRNNRNQQMINFEGKLQGSKYDHTVFR